MNLKHLFKYNDRFGCLEMTATWVKANYDGEEWIINYEISEFGINSHIHCKDLNDGIKQLIDIVIEHCIWENEDKTLSAEQEELILEHSMNKKDE